MHRRISPSDNVLKLCDDLNALKDEFIPVPEFDDFTV